MKPQLPLYCHECGAAYPWTDKILQAAKEIVDEAPNLSNEEKDQMNQDITDVVNEAPRAPAATSRLRKLITKAGEPTKNALIELSTKVASDVLVKLTRGW